MEESNITVVIKHTTSGPGSQASITIDKNCTVLECKDKISGVLNIPAVQQRLIYKGRIMKDDLTLVNYGNINHLIYYF